MTKNSGEWEGLQGHDDHPAQFKHKAWVHEGGGVAYIYIYMFCMVTPLTDHPLYIYIYVVYACIKL